MRAATMRGFGRLLVGIWVAAGLAAAQAAPALADDDGHGHDRGRHEERADRHEDRADRHEDRQDWRRERRPAYARPPVVVAPQQGYYVPPPTVVARAPGISIVLPFTFR